MINYTTRFHSIVVLIKVLKFLSFNTDKISNSYIVMHQMFSALIYKMSLRIDQCISLSLEFQQTII